MAFGKKKEKEEVKIKTIQAVPENDVKRFQRLFELSAKLDKEFGSVNTLKRPTEKKLVAVPSIITNLPTFDYDVSQSGGIPRGRIIEIFGPESAGKTTFTLHIMAEEQALGGTPAFVDAEHALDLNWAQKLGVDVDNMVLSQPDSGEQALKTVDALIESSAVSLIIVDSAAALVPEAELAGEIGDVHVGLQARMMSQAMRILTGKAQKHNVTVIFTNQIREKIGVMYGNPETTPTGRALRHYASMRIDVRRKDAITLSGKKEDTNIIGHQIKLKAVKNKVGVPYRETVVSLMYEDGFDKVGNLIEYAADKGVIEQTGAWYKFGEDNYQGMGQLSDALKADPKKVEQVRKAVKKIVEAEFTAAGV